MNRVFCVLGAAVLIVLVSIALQLGADRAPNVVEGAETLTVADYCPKPRAACSDADYQTVGLPHFASDPAIDGRRWGSYRLTPAPTLADHATPSVFVPSFSDNLRVHLNGQPISPDRFDHEPFHHFWHRPYYTGFAGLIVKPQGNLLDIELTALPSGRIHLSDVLIGAAEHLDLAAQRHHVERLGMVRTYSAVVMFAIVPILLLWLSRRRDRVVFWILFTQACGVIISLHLSLPNFRIWLSQWQVAWNAALLLYCYGVYQYARAYFGHPTLRTRPQIGLMGALVLAVAALVTSPPEAYLPVAAVVHLLSIALGTLAVAQFLSLWPSSDRAARLHVPFLVLAAGAGLNDYVFFVLAPEWAFQSRGGLGLMVIVVGIFVALFHRLATTLRGYERLNTTMRETIETRTAELAESQARISEIERTQAVAAERERIMFDLHDGVGGQLVNVMAYLETRGAEDKTLRTSLEEAMRDLALIIDSLEGAEDLPFLLASLRSRLDPILAANHVQLLWEEEARPNLLCQDPSGNLNTIRIVQEAVNNAMKHAKATQITVRMTARSISVTDNGNGFDPDGAAAQKRGTNSGLGLRGMKRRATEIGARFSIQSDTAGTTVSLVWD